MLIFVINFAYVLMLIAFLMHDILWLRSLMFVAQIIVVFYTWQVGVPVVSTWNLVFAGINVVMVTKILRDRKAVVLPAGLVELHARHFAALTPPEFLRWWRQGVRQVLSDAPLARVGQRPDALYFLLNGVVRVSRNRTVITDLTAGYFVAEMSLLTGEPANADVDALGPVELMQWPSEQLHALRQRDPSLWSKIQSAIGHDLVEKIRKGEQTDHRTVG